jgi:hypothetical protein
MEKAGGLQSLDGTQSIVIVRKGEMTLHYFLCAN